MVNALKRTKEEEETWVITQDQENQTSIKQMRQSIESKMI
jgi:hypothetical protein